MLDRTSLARMFSALGNPHRLAIFERLCRAEAERRRESGTELCVCAAAAGMGLSMSTISHHLKELRQAGLVTCQKRGQWVYCTVNQEALGLIQGFAGNGLAMCRREEQPAAA